MFKKLFLIVLILNVLCEEYPDPRIVVVGATGSGKSSLANALLGCDPRSQGCMFGVCGGTNSCTNETTIGTGPWLGNGQKFSTIDTPGFGDSSGKDNQYIQEMMEILDDELGHAQVILLILEGSTPRFSSGLEDMLKQMSSIFGEQWWDYMMIGVSKWKYDQESINKRQEDCEYYGEDSEFCQNEAWFIREFNQQLQDKFDLTKDFSFSFMDSFSQSGPNINDDTQQQHWIIETNKLWREATEKNSTLEFKTIDEVLEENAACKQENKYLHDIIDEAITNLTKRVNENEDAIGGFESTFSGKLEDVTKRVNGIEISVEENKEAIDDLEDSMTNTVGVPLGTITAWIRRVNGSQIYVNIPDGWVRCDGSTIPSPSIWAGQKTPDLNKQKRFLRGAVDEDELKLEDDQIHEHTHDLTDPGHDHGYGDVYTGAGGAWGPVFFFSDQHMYSHGARTEHLGTGIKVNGVASNYQKGDETRPKNMNVIYIMKVW